MRKRQKSEEGEKKILSDKDRFVGRVRRRQKTDKGIGRVNRNR